MGNYARLGGCSAKMAGKQRGGERTERENTEEVRDVTSARRDVRVHFQRGWGVRQQRFGRNRRRCRLRWGAWIQQVSAAWPCKASLACSLNTSQILESSWQNMHADYDGGSSVTVWNTKTRTRQEEDLPSESLRPAWNVTGGCSKDGWSGVGVTALYSGLLLNCGVGLHVGGGGLSGGEGDYITVLQTYAWWCKETPDELWKGERAEKKFPWKWHFKKCKVKASLIPLIFFFFYIPGTACRHALACLCVCAHLSITELIEPCHFIKLPPPNPFDLMCSSHPSDFHWDGEALQQTPNHTTHHHRYHRHAHTQQG